MHIHLPGKSHTTDNSGTERQDHWGQGRLCLVETYRLDLGVGKDQGLCLLQSSDLVWRTKFGESRVG